MKRILCLVLAFVMLLSLAACSSSLAVTEEEKKTAAEEIKTAPEKTEEEEKGPVTIPEGFSAGYARFTLNPEEGTFLGGFSNGERRSGAIQDDIKYTVTALSDGTSVFLLISTDTLYVSQAVLDQVGKLVLREYGIAAENVIMNATHTHSGPAIHIGGAAGIGQYLKKFYPLLVESVGDALRDLAPAEIYIGRANTVNLNYVRRYVSLADGSYLGGTSMPETSNTVARHETDADSQLQTIRLEREEKKDIVLCNWQCHTTSIGSEMGKTVSADWVYPLREEVEKTEDVLFSYHQGAAGNVVPSSRLKEEKDNGDYMAHGKAIAAVVSAALDSETKVQWGKFQATRTVFTGTHSDAYKKKEGVSANTDDMYLTTLSIGDVAFATTPCELHDTLGMYVKENSPFEMTFMCAYSNGTVSYVPTTAAFDNGGYEAGMFHFVRGTGEQMVEEVVKALKAQYDAK